MKKWYFYSFNLKIIDLNSNYIETRKSRDIHSDNEYKYGKNIPYMQTFWNLDTSQKRKVCVYGIFFPYLYFYIHYQIVYLYFSVFQLVSTNCFSMNIYLDSSRRNLQNGANNFCYLLPFQLKASWKKKKLNF